MEAFVYLTVVFGIALAGIFIRFRFLSFRGQRPSEYVGLGPDFDPRVHLQGNLICEGVIFGPTGRMTSRFRAAGEGRWDGNTGHLSLDFLFDGGATQHRDWRLIFDGENSIEAEAEDIVPRGKGCVIGPTLQLNYTLILPDDSGGHRLSVTDWMYLTESGTILNRSQFRKGGILVSELVATMRPEEDSEVMKEWRSRTSARFKPFSRGG